MTTLECAIELAASAHAGQIDKAGFGPAKLALLKISEAARAPHSVSTEDLERIANEDVWDEFVDINLGNWAGSDLRKMAEESRTKEAYDSHYGWTLVIATGSGQLCVTRPLRRV